MLDIEFAQRMVRVEEKIDVLIEKAAGAKETDSDLDARVTKLEGNQKLLTSLGAIILFIATFFQDWISSYVTG